MAIITRTLKRETRAAIDHHGRNICVELCASTGTITFREKGKRKRWGPIGIDTLMWFTIKKTLAAEKREKAKAKKAKKKGRR